MIDLKERLNDSNESIEPLTSKSFYLENNKIPEIIKYIFMTEISKLIFIS